MEPRQNYSYGRPLSFVAAIAMGLTLAGCYGFYEGKAEKNIKQAKDWNADTFEESKPLLEQAESQFSSAQGSKNTAEIKIAVKTSEQAAEAAKTRFADQQLKAAEEAVKVAMINDGQSQNAKLFTTAEEKLNNAREQYQKQKYENVINLGREVQGDVDRLLASLKNTSENQLSTLEARMKELLAAKAETYNPQPILRGNEAVENIRTKIQQERDYKQAIILAGGTISEIEAAIIESKKRNSEEQLRVLEDQIATAIAEEAPIHVPDALKTVQDRFEAILVGFYEKQYDSVLDAANDLKPRVNELITMARIEATKDRIRQVTEGIAKLKEQNVEQYLPGRIKVMEDLLTKSQEQFNNNAFEQSKFEAQNALVEQDRIVAAFDALAESTIQDATAAHNAAKSTYDRMRQIFGSGTTPVDARLEGRFQVRANELNARLDNAATTLNRSGENRQNKSFRNSIEQAKTANATSEAVANGTYKLVAENALLGIQDQISQLERQGARDYAAPQLNEVQNLVDRTQKLIAEDQNRQAAEIAAKTRASLENVKQELARRALQENNDTQHLLQRLEGGAAPTPASGGARPRVQRSVPYGEYPGGSDLNNKEAMLAEEAGFLTAADISGLARETVVIAQTRVGNPTNSTGWTGSDAYHGNRSLPGGTFMTSSAPDSVYLRTGAPSGAIVGTRPEPVVPTTEDTGAYVGGSQGSYEAPTGPGPFVAMARVEGGSVGSLNGFDGGAAIAPPPGGSISAIRQRIDAILLDDQRARDIQEFQPAAMEQARQRLAESSSALANQEYLRATELAQDAQRIIVEADRVAAQAAAERNIQDAADRINVAGAASAFMFAPAELNEAIRLYNQAKASLKAGEVHDARAISAQAIIAADDARLYNVNKARDLSALSVRYGGWKASHPALVEAETGAEIAAELLSRPDSAAQGQQIAQQAVALAMVALDSARDFTFQERLDNIYKALNVALRAGANYFNVQEIKRLMAELTVARDEYCTRNFDAVELKLKDIEARLARVIETTPLVLEQNLIETTEKLNALVLAGAEHWMAQEVDDVKSLMNGSVIDFRKHDYYSSYTNIRNAMALTDRIEQRLQEQVYYDAVTELFAQMDSAFHDFEDVLNHPPAFLKKLVATPHGQPAALSLSGRMSPNRFKDRIMDIYLRAIHLKPPKSLEGTHAEVLVSIKFAKVASENFQKLFILDQVSMPDAYDIIDTAYNQYRRSRILRGEVQVRLIEPEARTKVIRADKIVNF